MGCIEASAAVSAHFASGYAWLSFPIPALIARQEQAQQRAANAQRFAQRRAKWSAQFRRRPGQVCTCSVSYFCEVILDKTKRRLVLRRSCRGRQL